MRRINNLKPFSYSNEKNNFESNAHIHKKTSSLSPNKIYFFRTSLFTEKSKNFIIKLNSCEKNKETINSSNINNEVKTPKINTIIQPEKTTIRLKKGKIHFSQNKNVNKSDIDEKSNTNLKEKKDLSRNPIINKSSNDLINPNNISHLQKGNKSMTMDNKESRNNQDKNKMMNFAIKNLKKMNKEKIFAPLNNIINTNNNKQTIIVNYINQNHSIINLVNANSRPKQLTKDKVPKIETTHKIKYAESCNLCKEKKACGGMFTGTDRYIANSVNPIVT